MRFSHLLAFASVLLVPALTQAQDPFPTPTPTPDPLAGVQVQVLDQQQVTVGDHTITFNRIAPPVFPASTPPPSLAPKATLAANTTSHTSQAVRTKRASSRSPQTRSTKKPRSAQNGDVGDVSKQYKMLSLSVTVYDHQFTALRWSDGSAPALEAYVNLDFCYFTTVTSLETADTVYDLNFAWGNDTVDSLIQAGHQPPNLSTFPPGHTGYQIVSGDATTRPDAVAALNAICAYYDANSTQMITAYNQQQANNAAYQQWLQTHPPTQPNTVINFWPVKSRVYLPAAQ